jgi:hypothetical protein
VDAQVMQVGISLAQEGAQIAVTAATSSMAGIRSGESKAACSSLAPM